MAKLLKAVFKRLFQVFIFLLPVQLGYHFWPNWSFVFGIRVDYLSPTLYLTDILFLALFVLFLATQKINKRALLLGFLVIGFFGLINSIFASSYQPALFKWAKLLEFFFLGTMVATSKELKAQDWIIKPLFLSLTVVSLIGIFQVVRGGSLGGLFYFLGERAFGLSTPGIALASWGGREVLRAYSVFSHPNSLAGFLAAGIILLLPFLPKRKGTYVSVFLAAIILALALTFSLATALSLVVVLGILFLLRKTPGTFSCLAKTSLFIVAVVSIVFPLIAQRALNISKPAEESYSKRLELAVVAGKMFSEKPLTGTGLNNFTIELPQKSVGRPAYWWLQPVHNIFLLSLSETGIAGFLLLVFLFYLALERGVKDRKYLTAVLLLVLATGFFDHYWLTLQQNQLLLAVIFGLSFKNG